jgi:NAD(P)H-hydrate epimerase
MLLQPHTDFILTPHLGEMSRLRKESISYIKEHLIETAEEFARDYQVIMALKDAVSVCAIPYERTYLNLSGNDGMATAGSGDVLAGIIAGLIVTGMKPSEAAPYGMYLHGKAGDVAFLRKSAYSLMASDILDGISEVFSEIQS